MLDAFMADIGEKMHKGFTLIELLVVVLIIGVLSAVALPQYTKAVQRARVTEIWNYCKAFSEAQQVYYVTNGEFTGDLANLDLQMPELKYFSLSVSGYGGSSATVGFNSPTYFPSLSMSCWVGSNGRLKDFSCFDSTLSKKCVHLMPCSNPSIVGGSNASCTF